MSSRDKDSRRWSYNNSTILCIQPATGRTGERLASARRGRRPRHRASMWNREAGTTEDCFLPVKRQVVGVLGHQHMCQQTRSWDAFVAQFGRDRRLHQSLVVRANPFVADGSRAFQRCLHRCASFGSRIGRSCYQVALSLTCSICVRRTLNPARTPSSLFFDCGKRHPGDHWPTSGWYVKLVTV